MAAVSPARPTRRRTDFADFFRGSSSTHGSSPKKETPTPPEDSDVPHSHSPTTLQKVATKIPFLTRHRKKSTSSVRSGYISPPGYESSDVGSTYPATKKNW